MRRHPEIKSRGDEYLLLICPTQTDCPTCGAEVWYTALHDRARHDTQVHCVKCDYTETRRVPILPDALVEYDRTGRA